MAARKQINIYWGDNAFYIVETDKAEAAKAFIAPFIEEEGTPSFSPNTPEGIKLTTILQKSLQDNTVIVKTINLSLPTKDIIFRSFTIPFMQPSEIKNVVSFEIGKYIPFKVEEISYTYYPLTIFENKVRKISILFVAIRKDVLERYSSILEHSALSISCIEPSALSLIRVLTYKKLIPRNQTTAVVEVDGNEGRIIIVEQGFIQFVREFQLILEQNTSQLDPHIFQIRLFNEVRISLDYYFRQQKKERIFKIFILTDVKMEWADLSHQLHVNFGAPAAIIEPQSLMNLNSTNKAGLVNAYGLALRDAVPGMNYFDISLKSSGAQGFESRFLLQSLDLRSIFMTLGICAAALIISFLLTNMLIRSDRQKFANLNNKQGAYRNQKIEEIETQSKELKEKLLAYQDIRIDSTVSYYLAIIPKLLPKGAWLNALSIEYSETPLLTGGKAPPKKSSGKNKPGLSRTLSKVQMQMSGYIYNKDTNQQLRSLNQFISNLKENTDFANNFDSIELLNLKSVALNNIEVTQFEITCR